MFEYLHRIAAHNWTLCHDTNGHRYGQATTNMMKGFTGNIRRARFLPVTSMIEYLFYKAIKIVNTHRKNVEDSLQKWEELCSRTVRMLSKIQSKATAHTVKMFRRQDGIFTIRTHLYQFKGGVKGDNT